MTLIMRIIILAIGFATGWLTSLLARRTDLSKALWYYDFSDGKNRGGRRPTKGNKERTLSILATSLSEETLKDVYILVNNLYALVNHRRNLRFVLHILFFITSEGFAIESGIRYLKAEYENLFIPSSDIILRELHALSPEQVEKAILSTMRKMFDILKMHRNRKDVNSVLKHTWLAIDITDIPYYGKMASKRLKYKYLRGSKYVLRSMASIHNTKDGKATKYLTASIATGPLAGLLVYITPLKMGFSKSEEVNKVITFLSQFMNIELILMDRGFHSGEVYDVLRKHGIKYLTPARKTEGVKKLLFSELELEGIISGILLIAEKANKIATGTFHGRGYKGVVRLKSHLGTHLDSLDSVNSVDELVNWLREFKRMKSEVPAPLKVVYQEIQQLAEDMSRRITEPPRYIVQPMLLQGGKKITVILSLQLNEGLFRENLKKKFRNTASRVKDVRGQIDFETVLKRFFLDSYYAFVTPEYAYIDVCEQTKIYKRRWTVETAHKMFHQVLLRTTSNDISVRNMEVLIAVVMYDLWVIHRKNTGPVEEHKYEETLREFKMQYVRESFLLFEYKEGKCIFISNGAIVSLKMFMEGIHTLSFSGVNDQKQKSYSTCDDGRPPPIGVPVYVVTSVVRGVRYRI